MDIQAMARYAKTGIGMLMYLGECFIWLYACTANSPHLEQKTALCGICLYGHQLSISICSLAMSDVRI